MLDRETANALARGVVNMIDKINAFYAIPENEAAYQAWLAERRLKGGHQPVPAPEG